MSSSYTRSTGHDNSNIVEAKPSHANASKDEAKDQDASKSEATVPKSWSSLLRKTGTAEPKDGIDKTEANNTETALEKLWSWATNDADRKPNSLISIINALQGSPTDSFFYPTNASDGIPIVGMKNRGNTCFMNAILQSLLHLAPFFKLLTLIVPCYSMADLVRSPLIDSFSSLISDCKRSSGAILPENFYGRLLKLKLFGSGSNLDTQEDAHEFLLFLVEELHQEMVQCGGRMKTTEKKNTESSDWMQVTGKRNKAGLTRTHCAVQVETPLGKLFSGSFQSILHSPPQKDSITCEPFRSVEVDIEPDDIRSLEDAFMHFTRMERLETSTTKQSLFQYLPAVLIVQLKRFIWTQNGVIKSEKLIHIPQKLVLPRRLFASGYYDPSGSTYRLVSVILHHGSSVHGGHYTCMINRNSGWFHLDDEKVQRIQPHGFESFIRPHGKTKKGTPYLLFYEIVTK